jgi:hypothetical protein
VTPEQEHHLLAVFDGTARKHLACLGDEVSAFFAATRLLPHFDVVEKARAKAVIDYHLAYARKPNRNIERSLDIWILSYWTHHGLWALSNDDRRHLLGVWLERIVLKSPERKSFGALSSADALRMRIVRLGLIGYGAFPQTYPQAPLHCDPRTRQIRVAAPWQAMLACGPSTKKEG